MAVVDGQKVDAAVTNAAFMSRTQDTSTVGEVDILNTTQAIDASSGALRVKGGTGIEKSLFVGEELHVGQDAFLNNNLEVGGDLEAANAEFSGNVDIGGDLEVDGEITATGNITGANLSGINTGNISLEEVGNSPNDNGMTLNGQELNLEPASESFPGVVTTGDQTFAGEKTFQDEVILESEVFILEGLQLQVIPEPPAAEPGFQKFYIDDADNKPKRIDENGDVFPIGGGGGGGGGSIVWTAPNGTGAVKAEIEGLDVFELEKDEAQEVRCVIRVPESYEAGTQILLNLAFFSPDASFGTDVYAMRTVTTLLSPGASPFTSTTNQRNFTSDDFQTNTPNEVQADDFELTDSNGEINSVAVAPGDLLKITLSRVAPVGTETNQSVFFINTASEVIL